MAPGRTSSATNIVALALAFHRAPVQHPDLLHGRVSLPAGVGSLLKLAGGSPPDAESTPLASPDELRAAALFFVEQVLLHHDAGHYRVLGLEPDAPAEQIKEHHRLLMRVFHPDRERHDDDWKDAFATRINLAYTTLHDAASRRRYDATLKAHAGGPARRPLVHARPIRRRGLPPWLARHLPQWVLAGSALLAVAVVGTVYLNNPRPVTRLAQAPLAAEAPPAEPLPAVAAAAEAAPTKEPAAAPAVEAARPQNPAPKPVAPPKPVVTTNVPAPAPKLPKPDVVAAKRAMPVAQAPEARLPAPAAPDRTANAPAPAAPPPTIQQAPAAPRATPTVAEAPPRVDPDATLARFMTTYERGDTPGLMALFDEVAIGNAGGKPQIRRAHESLFRSTELRHIAFEKMAWAQEGDWLRGRGRYQATLMRKGEPRLETESGVVRIELLRRGDQALIMALDYQPGERS